MEKTTLYLPLELQQALRHAARRSHRSQAELVREAIRDYLSEERVPLPRSIGVVSDGSLNSEDVDDWLRENWDPLG